MRISQLQKKLLVLLLRYEQGEISSDDDVLKRNNEFTYRHGLSAKQVNAYTIKNRSNGLFICQRAFKSLIENDLVYRIPPDISHRAYRFHPSYYMLTKEGTKKATEIAQEMKQVVDEWTEIFTVDSIPRTAQCHIEMQYHKK